MKSEEPMITVSDMVLLIGNFPERAKKYGSHVDRENRKAARFHTRKNNLFRRVFGIF